MRVVVQRVMNSSVAVDNNIVAEIGKGLLILAGMKSDDTDDDLRYMAGKIVNLRIFEDEERKLNRSVLDIDGELLVVSQFTLYADCRKGRRPSFIEAAFPALAADLFERFVAVLREYPLKVKTGVFQAMMDVRLCNYGPVTVVMESKDMRKQ